MTKLKLIALAILQGVTIAHADNTSPAINPQRSCMAEGMINPPDKNYRYLFSNDCSVVHVVPPEVLPQKIKGEGIGLRACEGLATLEGSINRLQVAREEASSRSYKFFADSNKTNDPREARRLREKAESEQRVLNLIKAEIEDAQNRLRATYGRAPGARFAIILRSDIDARDLSEIRNFNQSNLIDKKVIETRENGKVVDRREETEIRALRPAKIGQSVFSLLYKVPKNIDDDGGILSTNIPGLQYLEQDQQEGVIHVKASGGVSGELIMNQRLACQHAKTDSSGKIVLEEDTDPFFVVNRTFTVQQMFSQGYVAELRVDKVVDQITKSVINHTDQGFKKSVVFHPSLTARIDQIVDFNWTEGWDSAKNASLEEIFEIQKSVAAKLIDDYIERLRTANLIEIKPDPATPAATGGLVDETRNANRCWTERDDGVMGKLGRRHTVCSDYTYLVKVWKDGATNDEINRRLTLHGKTTDTMLINTMVPFSYSTAFTK